ncbi:Hpt domain-containing protein [Chamaesiphon minutus]|uniref:Chemotaxis protein histidine kinase-like protein n=1 Tax=Chamaesiphon minutus (strain ATCC 27169 / PCC 6605) TaxID=1173020 RepID=K9UQD6_CHAP6|nr:Hpt domain-containing protein [Chamaesiphon minutus]AFY96439.1 chemotaxis protein histidine kinase-like protein [Chamaesiphon minutus PCC 6605]
MNDSQIQAQAYSYFLAEAPELLHVIEQEILTLPNEHTTAKVHNLMRALHTLKGAAANVGLTTIERIAHNFEDVTRVFYDLDVEIDVSIQTLLLDGYSGLSECLTAHVATGESREIDESAIVERMTATIEQLKEKLGDWSETEIALPTAIELGFDIVASIFETTIQEQIDEVVTTIATHDPDLITQCLHSVADICISLAESFELPGFLAINQAILAAITNHPDRVSDIALLALIDLQQAQSDVLAGDRTIGGTISPALEKLAQSTALASDRILVDTAAPDLDRLAENSETWADIPQADLSIETEVIDPREAELKEFQAFLISDRFRKRNQFSTDNQHLFDRIVRLCWDWFRHEIQALPAQLNLEILVMTEGLTDLDYIHHWIGLLLKALSPSSDRDSLYLYRQCCIYQVVFAVAKYLAGTEPHPQLTPEFLTELRLGLQTTVNTYKQGSPVTANERGWIDRIILPHHWLKNSEPNPSEDLLLTEIWGQLDFGKNH